MINNIIVNDFNIHYFNFEKSNYKIDFKTDCLLTIVNKFHFH